MNRVNSIWIKHCAIYIVVVFIIACNINKKHKLFIAKDKSETKLQISSGVGDITVQSFEGSIYHNSYCIFTIYKYKHSGDGIFSISILNANKELFTADGRVYTLKGKNDTTEWECVINEGEYTFYFLLDLDNERICLKPDKLNSGKLHQLYLISTKTIQ